MNLRFIPLSRRVLDFFGIFRYTTLTFAILINYEGIAFERCMFNVPVSAIGLDHRIGWRLNRGKGLSALRRHRLLLHARKLGWISFSAAYYCRLEYSLLLSLSSRRLPLNNFVHLCLVEITHCPFSFLYGRPIWLFDTHLLLRDHRSQH